MSDNCASNPSPAERAITDALASPSSMSADGISQSNRSLSELIAADKYLRSRRASRCRGGRLFAGMITHAIPPGTCDR